MAVPGSVVGVGKLITPGGQQGPKGDSGTSASGGTSHYYDYDDFMGWTAKFSSISNSAGAGAVSAITPSTAVYPYGFVQLAAGTLASQFSRIYTNAIFLSTRPIIWRALVNPVNAGATSATQHLIGFNSIINGVIVTTAYYCLFYYAGTLGANWQAHVRSLTAFTTVDTGVNVTANLNTWFDLKIVATSTSVAFYINGTLVTTITTNIPPTSQALSPSVVMANGADTTNRSIYIDAIELDIDTGVTGRFMKALV